jgi:hypothetical protein
MANESSEPATRRAKISRAGGLALYKKHGAEHMRSIGDKGRATIRKKYGLRYFSEIARRKRHDDGAGTESAA